MNYQGPTQHGTNRGYVKHIRRDWEPIDAEDTCGCRAAHSAYMRERRLHKEDYGFVSKKRKPARGTLVGWSKGRGGIQYPVYAE